VDFRAFPIYAHGCLETKSEVNHELSCEAGKYFTATSPTVVVYSTLKDLDSTLYQVAFKSSLPPYKDLGLDFSQEIGTSWQDVSEELRPNDLTAKYPPQAPRFLNLEEAVQDILDRQTSWNLGFTRLMPENFNWLRDNVGYPSVPQCFNKPAFLKDGESWPTPGPFINNMLYWVSSRDRGTDVATLQARLFNLSSVSQSLTRNAKPGPNGQLPGLFPLTLMFYDVFYSTPAGVRGKANPSAQGVENNLYLIPATVRLGALTQLGRFVSPFEADDPDLEEFFVSLVNWITSDRTRSILVDAFDADRNSSVPSAVALSALKLVNDIQENIESRQSWSAFVAKSGELKASQEYRDLSSQLGQLGGAEGRMLLDFLEESGAASEASKTAAQRFREFLSQSLLRGDWETFLTLAKLDRTRFDAALKTLSDYIGQGEAGKLIQFLEVIQSSVREPAH
jgi:hypothetical protein